MFSKAKITRFNEVEGCAPPPGSYDPKFEEKLVGGVLSKTQRFPELLGDEALGVAAISVSTEHLPKKTPLKTPKYVKPLPKSSHKKKITTSLQDLSKVLQSETGVTKLKDEIDKLKAKLGKSEVFHKRVASWVSTIDDLHIENLSFIVDEWQQFSDLTNLRDFKEYDVELERSHNLAVELKAQAAEQEKTISDLQNQIDFMSTKCNHLEDLMGSMSEGSNNLQNVISELERDKKQLQEQMLHKCDLMEEIMAADETMQKEIHLTKSYSKTLEDNFNLQSQEIRNLQMQLAAFEELLEKKSNLESINENLEAELRRAKEETAVLHLNLASTDSTLEILREEKSLLVKHLQVADEGIVAIEDQLRLKNEEFGAKIDDVSTKAQFLETQMATLQEQLKATIRERDTLKEAVADTNEKLAHLEEEHLETLALMTHEGYKKLLEDHVKLGNDVIAARQEQKQSLADLKQSMEKEYELGLMLFEATKEKKEVLEAIHSKNCHLEVDFSNVARTKILLAYFFKEVANLKTSAENLKEKLQEREEELQELTGKNDTEVKAKEKLARKLNGTKALQKNLQERLTIAESDMLVLNKKLQLSLEKEAKSSVVITDLTEEANSLKQKLSQATNEKDKSILELTKINDILRREIEDVQTSLEAIKFYKESIQSEVDNAIEKNSLLQTENEKLKTDLKKAGSDLGVVQEELRGAKEHLQEHLTEANKNIHALNQQLSEAQIEVYNLKRESIEANESIFELCHKLLDLEKMNNEAKFNSAEMLRKIAFALDMKGEISITTIEARLVDLNKYVEELEDEFAESVLLKMKVEDELEEERIKAVALKDDVFDIRQDQMDMQMCLESVSRKLMAIESEKQSLEDEFAKAEKDWDVREQKLMTDIKLLAEEAKEAEDKQIEYEEEILLLKDEVVLLKQESEWEEKKQLKLEEELAEVEAEKERAIEKCARLDQEVAESKKKIEKSTAEVEQCWAKAKEVEDLTIAMKQELNEFYEAYNKQDQDLTALEELLKEKEEELGKLKEEKDGQISLMEGRLQDQDAAMKRLLNEVESSVQAADEMEDLLQRKIAELGRTKENVGKLEAHSKSLLDKTIVLEEKEMKAQSEMKKAQVEAAQANKVLESQMHEFSMKWSTMEDSIMNLESVEACNKDLSANDSNLRSQVSILEGESKRLRSVNTNLRERLLELEKLEAKSSGHQNHLQKLSYMQNLKEVVFKHEANEEEMHARLVASECKVAQLESELQKHGISLALSKSMVVEGVSATAKKSRHGKENRSLMASLSRTAHSLLSTSTPLHRKSPLQPKNN